MITGYRNTVEPLPDGKTMPLVDLLDPLPDELKPLCQELRPKVEALNENDLRGHFEIGQILKQEIPRIEGELQKNGRSCYGTHLFEQLGVQFDVHPRILRGCVEVAKCFTPSQYEARIIQPGLTWSHARLLATVAHPIRREQLIDRAIAERLSVKTLTGLVGGVEPKKPRGPGRSPAPPRDLSQGLARLCTASKTYQNVLGVLFGDEFDVLTEIRNARSDALTPERRAAVAECAEWVAGIVRMAKVVNQRLLDGLELIDARIAAQAKQEEAIQAEEIAESPRNQRKAPVYSA